ncbi:hypothetical protein [Rhodoferax mekongensis]|uniref:Uncharacterized protein n=1 Tax=Rhodoferax mekongensis TaxID=3068341 RepID=A0ABZ0B2F6_9BURK|nr:hypothetical protein [Rhodoferax sp. TBRC 17307]WNO06038.1 hypothetical protein RAN89_06305 [Rhodoferax sp. TBRC 17307]
MRAALLSLATVAALGASLAPATSGSQAQRAQTEINKLANASGGQSGGLPANAPTDTRTNTLRSRSRIRRDTRIKKAGPGWSNRHVQRTAAKARNVKRSKGKR